MDAGGEESLDVGGAGHRKAGCPDELVAEPNDVRAVELPRFMVIGYPHGTTEPVLVHSPTCREEHRQRVRRRDAVAHLDRHR